MKNNNYILPLLICFIIVLSCNLSKAQEMVLIVNKNNPVSSMKKIEVKLFYMRKVKKSWPDTDAPIKPAGLSIKNPAKDEFMSQIMKMSEAQLEAYFKQQQFSNGENPPELFGTESELVDYVSKTEGAIAYISKNSFIQSGGKVKSVNIQ